MAKAYFDPSDDRFTRGMIRRKVNQLIGRAGFTNQDREDLEQELLARVLQSLSMFDPNKGHRNVFITTVIERYVANILRNKRAAKRHRRRTSSLSVVTSIDGERPTELAQTIGERERDARTGCQRRSDEELAELAIDLADVIATLPESWQTLLELRKTLSMSEVSHEMGVPRTTLYDRMRRIRQRFEKAGMRVYL